MMVYRRDRKRMERESGETYSTYLGQYKTPDNTTSSPVESKRTKSSGGSIKAIPVHVQLYLHYDAPHSYNASTTLLVLFQWRTSQFIRTNTGKPTRNTSGKEKSSELYVYNLRQTLQLLPKERTVYPKGTAPSRARRV
jgi:hypothetical protein